MTELDGRSCIVTGATRGIGRAIAARFAAEGAVVGVGGRNGDEVRSVAELVGGLPLPGDVGRPAVASSLVDEMVAATGRIDVVVNNAAIARDRYLTRLTDEDWEESMAVNLGAPFRLMRAAVPAMKGVGGGSIVNMISWAGLRGSPGQIAYSASKAGLIGVTLTAAKELGRFNIRVNALAPSAETAMTAELTLERRTHLESLTPLGGLGDLDAVVEAAVFLAGTRSRYTTGQVLNVDGGLHLH